MSLMLGFGCEGVFCNSSDWQTRLDEGCKGANVHFVADGVKTKRVKQCMRTSRSEKE